MCVTSSFGPTKLLKLFNYSSICYPAAHIVWLNLKALRSAMDLGLREIIFCFSCAGVTDLHCVECKTDDDLETETKRSRHLDRRSCDRCNNARPLSSHLPRTHAAASAAARRRFSLSEMPTEMSSGLTQHNRRAAATPPADKPIYTRADNTRAGR